MPQADQGITNDRYTVIPRTAIFLRRGDSYLLLKGAPTKRLWANMLYFKGKKANMIYQIKQSELPKKLWNLIDAALRGEPVFIERDDKALIQLIPLKQMFRPRKAGSAKGMLKMSDDFDTPLGDFAEYMP
ncbi:MAG TPA: DUF2281 domain-containing protein [Anaerolineales bacterium]|nr:DUF2281 domain-containing protein [Anaerolineales bacterium]